MEQKFKEAQEVWVKCKYRYTATVGHTVRGIHTTYNFQVSDDEIRATPPTEPDTELSDILQTAKSAKREFVERVAPMLLASMINSNNSSSMLIKDSIILAADLFEEIKPCKF